MTSRQTYATNTRPKGERYWRHGARHPRQSRWTESTRKPNAACYDLHPSTTAVAKPATQGETASINHVIFKGTHSETNTKTTTWLVDPVALRGTAAIAPAGEKKRFTWCPRQNHTSAGSETGHLALSSSGAHTATSPHTSRTKTLAGQRTESGGNMQLHDI